MRSNETSTERDGSKLRQDCSAAWGGARTTTQSVAFRVTRVEASDSNGLVPVWEPCPLTEEEEAILQGLEDYE